MGTYVTNDPDAKKRKTESSSYALLNQGGFIRL